MSFQPPQVAEQAVPMPVAAVEVVVLDGTQLAMLLGGFDPDRRDTIVFALIGETGNSVVAGHVSLRFARA